MEDPVERDVVARFARRIRLYGLRHLRKEDAAADLVQEVLLIVIDALRGGRVKEPAQLERFVLGTCRNVVSGWRRGEKRRAGLADTLAGAGVAVAPPPAPPEPRRLFQCMGRLRDRERAVLLMSYCEEREAHEIGRLLGLSDGNVRVLRHRALGVVKQCLETGGGA
jgi:RNA polymerase sigma-70 factor, ECF subfamily